MDLRGQFFLNFCIRSGKLLGLDQPGAGASEGVHVKPLHFWKF